ncbi:MAG TPA: hypothetical protein VK115_07130 [Staphylococcus sp.]|nr:hypothetical protein [Staphylococcus sp.]
MTIRINYRRDEIEHFVTILPNIHFKCGYENQITPEELNHVLSEKLGFISMFNTNDLVALANKYTIDSEDKLAFDALAYQIPKMIDELVCVFNECSHK